MTTERTEYPTEWHHKRQPRKQQRDDNRHLIATDITAKGLHMETRGLQGALRYQAADQEAYQMAYQRIKELSPNGILN